MMRRSVITHMNYSVGGTASSLEESARAGRLLSSAENLGKAGFHSHHLATPAESAYSLAQAAVRGLNQDLRTVDAIVYACCIPENANTGSRAMAVETRDVKYLMDYPGSRLQADFAMHKAIVFGLTQQACTGFLGALRLAKMLIATEAKIQRVLCVTADRFPENALYEQSYNLISDGAACALFEADGEGYEIVTAHQLTNGAMSQASDDETVGHFFSYTYRLVQETLQRGQVNIGDVRWVIPQNTNSSAWQIIAKLLRLPFSSVALETLASVGHMISGDNIANLSALHQSDKVAAGDYLLMLMAGYGLNWQSVLLRRV